jgi:hypothetical protein
MLVNSMPGLCLVASKGDPLPFSWAACLSAVSEPLLHLRLHRAPRTLGSHRATLMQMQAKNHVGHPATLARQRAMPNPSIEADTQRRGSFLRPVAAVPPLCAPHLKR